MFGARFRVVVTACFAVVALMGRCDDSRTAHGDDEPTRRTLTHSPATLSGSTGEGETTRRADSPSVRDTANRFLERLRPSFSARDQGVLEGRHPGRLLNPGELRVFAAGHIRLRVDQPVHVSVFHDRSLGADPFWLQDAGWRRAGGMLKLAGATFDIRQKAFPPGEIGLGVNSLRGGGHEYFVVLQGSGAAPLRVDDLSPAVLQTTNFVVGATPWADRDEILERVPAGFERATLVETLHASRDEGRIVGRLRRTSYPASSTPDEVVLTWCGDPRTKLAIQWRTSIQVSHGAVVYTPAANRDRPLEGWQRVDAVTSVLRARLKIRKGPATRDFVRGRDGETGASPQRAVTFEPTKASRKRPVARRVFAGKAAWLRCSSVTDP